VPKSTIHKILRNRIYSGDFDFDSVTYHGTYESIVSRDLWEQVQVIFGVSVRLLNVRVSRQFGSVIRTRTYDPSLNGSTGSVV